MRTNYFQSISGNQSSSRLIGFIVIMYSLLESSMVLYLGKEQIMLAATASATMFITKAGSAMAFLFAQKKQEVKQEAISPQ